METGFRIGKYDVVGNYFNRVFQVLDGARTIILKAEPTEYEKSILPQLDHDRIVKYYGVQKLKGPKGKVEFLIMEDAGRKGLDDLLYEEDVPQRVMRKYLLDTIDAVEYLQSKDIAHRDLHGGNIMASVYGGKLIDFGYAAKIGTKRHSETVSQKDLDADRRQIARLIYLVRRKYPFAPSALERNSNDDVIEIVKRLCSEEKSPDFGELRKIASMIQ